MNKQHGLETIGVLCGLVTSVSFGQMIFQGLGTVILGMLGALGGYLFIKFIKPRLDSWIDKKKAE